MSNVIALSEAAAIGLHSMALVAVSKKVLNVTEISKTIGSSKHHTAKIVQRLSKKGLLKSTRGPSGGFCLKKEPIEISLLNIYEAVEGKVEVHSCLASKETCPFDTCLLGDLATKMSKEIWDYLSSKKLSDFIQN